jgi:hypothetical protein
LSVEYARADKAAFCKEIEEKTMTIHAMPPPRPGSPIVTKAPRHLPSHERDLWDRIVSTARFEDAASLSALAAGLEAHTRMRRCREQIDRDGEAVRDRFGQLRAHPLLNAERDARHAFLTSLKLLRLDLTGVE